MGHLITDVLQAVQRGPRRTVKIAIKLFAPKIAKRMCKCRKFLLADVRKPTNTISDIGGGLAPSGLLDKVVHDNFHTILDKAAHKHAIVPCKVILSLRVRRIRREPAN